MKQLILPATIALLAGCSSLQNGFTSVKTTLNTPQAKAALSAAAKVLGTDAVAYLSNVALGEVTKGKLDFASGAGTELFAMAGDLESSDAIGNLVAAFKLPKTAAAAATVADTPNTNPLSVVTNAIATVLSAAAGAPPANPVASIAAH